MRAMGLLVPLVVVTVGRVAHAAASAYDDRVMIGRAIKAANSVRGRWQRLPQATSSERKALAAHLNELRAVVRAVGVVLRSRDAPKEIVAHRRAIKASTERFLARIDLYSSICRSYAAMGRKLGGLKRSKPPKPS